MENKDDQGEEMVDEKPEPTAMALRARNRTVMLSPEMTGKVRAKMSQDTRSVDGDKDGYHTPRELGMGSGRPTPPPSSAPVAPQSTDRDELPSAPEPSYQAERSETRYEEPRYEPPFRLEPQSHRVEQRAVPVAPAGIRQQSAPQGSRVIYKKISPIAGFLISFDEDQNGEIFELRVGRIVVTSESAQSGNFLWVDHESVSPMHAVIKIGTNGELQVLDQLSEFGTRIQRSRSGESEELSGEKGVLFHGDVIQFGQRSFSVCLIHFSEG